MGTIQLTDTRTGGVFRHFSDRKIGTKIAIGFACVLAVTAVIAVGAGMAFKQTDKGLWRVVHSSGNLASMLELERSFAGLRGDLREFEQSGAESARDSTKKALAAVNTSIAQLVPQVIEPGRHRQAEDLATQFSAFDKPLQRVIELREKLTHLQRDVLTPLGAKLVSDFHDLRQLAYVNGDKDVMNAVNQGNTLLMEMRINSIKFNTRNDKAAGAAAEQFYQQLNVFVVTLAPIVSGNERKVYKDLGATLANYRKGSVESGKVTTQLGALRGEMGKLAAAIAANVETLKQSVQRNAKTVENDTRDMIARTGLFILILACGGLVIGGLLAFAIGRMISKPIVGLVPQLEKLAQGDFNVTVPGRGRKDEVGQIAAAVALMAEKVSSTIAEIKASGREVTNASAEISTSTTDLSQRTEEQAASLEETSAAMEQLSATVKKNAENAQQANQSASATRDVADRGGQVVAQAVQAMAKIEDSSRKISDIIGVIDEIARQTNLLALNAAVEAARAGEAGRGFAVVASEVRSLAQRSSQAAKDITDLITNSNGQVKDGVDLVNKAGASLSEIVESIKSVATVVAEIANASAEQATGIEEINRALNQMDEVTQQNSALVEENAATAKTLEHQAKALDDQVAFFQIASGDEGGPRERADDSELSPVTVAPSRGPGAKFIKRAAA